MEEAEVMISVKEFMEILSMELELNVPQRDYFNMTSKDVYAAAANDSSEYVRFMVAMEIKKRYLPEQYEADQKALAEAIAAQKAKAEEVVLPTPPEGSLQ